MSRQAMADALVIKDLSVVVEGQELLHDINLVIPQGEVHALLGLNGGGKTSILMTIMGYPAYQVTRGKILFEGQDITSLDLPQRAQLGISITHQRPPTIRGVKLRQVLEHATIGCPDRVGRVAEWVKRSRMEAFLDRDVNTALSGGEIKRSELLQLLALRPRFSMIDEPGSGVDLESMRLVGDMINELFSIDPARPVKRKAGLIITHTGHILDYVHADKAHIVLDGRIACEGNPGLILEKISECGYSECVRCMSEGA